MIGTWIGAGIGIVALVGIVGPVLVWLASRTDRHKTLNAMGRDTNGYISPGWHLGPNIYLGQRMKAPELRQMGPNAMPNGILNFDAASLKPFKTESRWVHFGALLEAYGMQFTKGGDILIKDGKTYLPIHPSWILAVGILGRYSSQKGWQGMSKSRRFTLGTSFRNDKPRPLTSAGGYPRSSTAQVAQRQQHFGVLPQPPPMIHNGPQPEHRRYEETDIAETLTDQILHGITGSLGIYGPQQQINSPFPTLTYRSPSATIYAAEIQTDILPMKELFLLSLGLVKIREGQYASLADSWPAESWGQSSRSGSESDHPHERQRAINDRRYRSLYGNTARERYETGHRHNRAVTVLRLRSLDITESLEKVSGPFANLNIGHEIEGFTPEDSQDTLRTLSKFEGSTYVPADDAWVRVVDGTYIPRVDAQRMALALLRLPWVSQGYLIGGDGYGVATDLFTAASNRLRPMMVRLQEKVSLLDVTEQDKGKLSTVMEPVLRRLDRDRVDHDTQTFRKLYDLNKTLLELGSPENQVVADEVVAILSITNEEFRDIVHQSIRNLSESTAVTVDLDLRPMTLKVPSVFGVRQSFHVDWDIITETTSGTRPHETIPVKHTAIVLASMRSLVLCMMLRTCSDAGPLLQLVEECGDMAYMD